jgi:hypothetical protein
LSYGNHVADFGLARESVKGLGPGAYLVNVLPSTVLVAGALALIASRLYPWQSPISDSSGSHIPPGPASLIETVRGFGAAGSVLLVLFVLVVTVILRPFQISFVQVLEGYWKNQFGIVVAEAAAVERHIRRRSLGAARLLEIPQIQVGSSLGAVARQSRQEADIRRRLERATDVLEQYPDDNDLIMPTLLGNVLRRAEKSAGERYGLDTVITYPRIYPYLSPRLHQETTTQLNLIDTASTLTVVFGLLAILASPIVARVDWWSALPFVFLMTSALSYRGARIAAGRYGVLLASAFDLHRFEMLAAMHRKLPVNAKEEYGENQALCRVLAGSKAIDERNRYGRWSYDHPTSS